MGITVSHQPDVGALGSVAAGVGQGQAEQQAFSNAMNLFQLGQRERMQERDINRSIWSQLASQGNSNRQLSARMAESRLGRREGILANQQSQAFARAGRERMAMFERSARAEGLIQQEQMRNRLANADWDRQKEAIALRQEAGQQEMEFKLNAQQKRRQQELQNGIQYVQSQDDWSDEQKANAIEQLEMQYHQIQPLAQPKEELPWPEERAPGKIWEDRGYLWSTEVDANGGVRVKQHGPAPSKEGDYDQKLISRGDSVYQRDANGKEVEVLGPPELPSQRDWNSTYDSIIKSMSVGDNVPDHKKALYLTNEVIEQRTKMDLERHRLRQERLLNPVRQERQLNPDDPVQPPPLPPIEEQEQPSQLELGSLEERVNRGTGDMYEETKQAIINNVGQQATREDIELMVKSGLVNIIKDEQEWEALEDGEYYIDFKNIIRQKSPDDVFDDTDFMFGNDGPNKSGQLEKMRKATEELDLAIKGSSR